MDLPQQGSWPDAVGKDVDEVVQSIQSGNPNLNVVKVVENSPVTRDFRFDRVRVFYNASTNLVVSEPRTG